MFRNRYKIVSDHYAGYEVRFRPWWSPFYIQCYGTNTLKTLAAAEGVALNHSLGRPYNYPCDTPKFLGKLPPSATDVNDGVRDACLPGKELPTIFEANRIKARLDLAPGANARGYRCVLLKESEFETLRKILWHYREQVSPVLSITKG